MPTALFGAIRIPRTPEVEIPYAKREFNFTSKPSQKSQMPDISGSLVNDAETPTQTDSDRMESGFDDPRVLEYFRARVQMAEAPVLLPLVRKYKVDLVKGFRPGHEDPKVVRKRLHALLEERDGVRKCSVILREISLRMPVISVLSDEAIRFAYPRLTDYFGAIPFLGSLLIDPREELVEFAKVQLRKYKGDYAEPAPSPESARAVLRDLGPFFNEFGSVMEHAKADLRAPTTAPAKSQALTAAQIKHLVTQDRRYQALMENLVNEPTVIYLAD